MKRISKELTFVAAIVLDAVAVNLMVVSDLGISTISSLPYVLSQIITSISFGMMNFMVQSLTLVILMCITKKPSPYYILSFIVGFIFGLLVDLLEPIIGMLPSGLILQVIYFLLGWVIMCFSVALFHLSELPVQPFDTIVKDLVAFFKSDYKKTKTIIDVSFLSTAIVCSFVFLKKLVGVGIGTIFMTIFTGSLEGKILQKLKSNFKFVAYSEICTKLESLKAIK